MLYQMDQLFDDVQLMESLKEKLFEKRKSLKNKLSKEIITYQQSKLFQ
jgi:hypothetical protein